MEFQLIIIGIVALCASGLTLFYGFGLGTILMPVFAVFFPLEVAIALTAIVHFTNNLFKFVLLAKEANSEIILRFGIAAVFAAIFGSQLLFMLNQFPPIYSYIFQNREFFITPTKLVISALMIGFVVLETFSSFKNLSFNSKYLTLGGILSGFFGGLSGHQGALRSAFLVKAGLSKESFIATGVVIACLVDLSRVFIYSSHFKMADLEQNWVVLITAVLCAFIGVFLATRLVKKVTMEVVQKIVSVMLFLIAILLMIGLI